jgi:hypothetical protein
MNVTSSMFSRLPSLEYLEASACSISNIHENAFSRNPRLTTVELNGNDLTSFNFTVFRTSAALIHLELSNNRIARLSVSNNAYIANLTRLYLNNNAISSFPMAAVKRFTRLVELQLSGNVITTLSGDTNTHRSLATLKLNYNQIAAIGTSFLGTFPNLVDFGVLGNGCIDKHFTDLLSVDDEFDACFAAYNEMRTTTTSRARTSTNEPDDDDDDGISPWAITRIVLRILMIAVVFALIAYFIAEIFAIKRRRNAARAQAGVAVIAGANEAGNGDKPPPYERF